MKTSRSISKPSIISLKMNPALHMPEVYYREKCDRAGYKFIKKNLCLFGTKTGVVLHQIDPLTHKDRQTDGLRDRWKNHKAC